MPDERELDHLIDSALSTYAEPRADLEARVLANLAAGTSKPEPTRRRWLSWAIALPIAACIVLMLMLYPRHDRIEEPVHQAQQSPAPQTQGVPQNSIAQAAQLSARPHRPHIVVARATHSAPAPLPKLDVFPTPQPLSPEERTFVRYVANMSESDRKALAATQDQPITPLAIAAIQIQPLAPLDKSEN